MQSHGKHFNVFSMYLSIYRGHTYIGTLGQFVCGHHLNIQMFSLRFAPGLYQSCQNLNSRWKEEGKRDRKDEWEAYGVKEQWTLGHAGSQEKGLCFCATSLLSNLRFLCKRNGCTFKKLLNNERNHALCSLVTDR